MPMRPFLALQHSEDEVEKLFPTLQELLPQCCWLGNRRRDINVAACHAVKPKV